LASLKEDEFPLVIDPTTTFPGLQHFESIRWNFQSNAEDARVSSGIRLGDPDDAALDPSYALWRTFLFFNYDSYLSQTPKWVVNSAHIRVWNDVGLGGDFAGTRPIDAWWSVDSAPTGLTFSEVIAGGGIPGSHTEYDGASCAPTQANPGPSCAGNVNVIEKYGPWFRDNVSGGVVGLTGEETPGDWFTYKQYNVAELQLVLNRQPYYATVNQPTANAVVSTTTPLLKANPPGSSEPDGDTIKHWFRLWSGNDPLTGQVANSGWLPASTPEWQVPAGTLRDGTSYCWLVYTWDQQLSYENGSITGPAQSCFKVDLRLGANPFSPSDQVGPVTVNAATGNLTFGISTPVVPTVGGDMGVSLSYNSQAQSPFGLRGQYFNDVNDNRLFDDAQVMERVDAAPSFNWGVGSPHPSISADKFLVRWTGFVRVPDAADWVFGVVQDDGVRVWIDNNAHLDRWTDQAGGVFGGGPAVTFSSGALTKALKVEYYENGGGATIALYARRTTDPTDQWTQVQSDWLTTSPYALPTGWTLSGLRSKAAFIGLTINDNVVLRAADGANYEFKKVASAVGSTPGFTPPAGGPSGRPSCMKLRKRIMTSR
jgi:hypothetical protein